MLSYASVFRVSMRSYIKGYIHTDSDPWWSFENNSTNVKEKSIMKII